MKGMKRSLLYWGRLMEKYFITICFLAVVMCLMMGLMQGEFSIDITAAYISLIGILAVMVQAANNANYFLPQAISFGSTRKESLVGMQVFTHIVVLQFMLITMLIVKYLPNYTSFETKELLLLYSFFFLTSCGAGNGVCAVILRFGKSAGMWIYVIYIVLIVFLEVGSMVADLGIGAVLVKSSVWGIFAAVIFDIVMIGLCAKAIQKYEVRA